MLVLTRKKGETIIIGEDIQISVLDIKGDQIRIGIDAPRHMAILRKEIYTAVKEENEIARNAPESNLGEIEKIIKKGRNL